jgi:hypothetical protein
MRGRIYTTFREIRHCAIAKVGAGDSTLIRKTQELYDAQGPCDLCAPKAANE